MAESQMDAGVKQSLPLPDSDVLTVFAEFLRLNVAAGDASPQTVRNYAGQARAFFQWALDAGLDPRAASERDLQAYRRYLVEQDYAPGTIAFKLAVVRRLYDALVWRGVRADNPAAGLKAPKDRTAPEERVSYLPLEGLRRLLAAPDAETVQGRRDRAILALMGRHGLRVGEVAALDLEAWDAGAGDWGAMAVVGKGNKRRTIYLTEGTARALDAWAEVRADVAQPEAPALFVATRGGGRSRRPPGTRLTTRAIRSVVDGYLEDVGLKAEGVSCHSLRHSAATWARFGGAKLDAIGDMLGHSKPETTMVYAKIVNKMQENPAVFLDAVLGDVEG